MTGSDLLVVADRRSDCCGSTNYAGAAHGQAVSGRKDVGFKCPAYFCIRSVCRSEHRLLFSLLRFAPMVWSIVLVIGTLLLLMLGPTTPVAIILLVAAVIGIPNGLNNIGLLTALYSNTKPASLPDCSRRSAP
ncbi:hypothetical protein ACFU8X_15970 [Brevibacillus porteri]|uniref:hypothetical protein n=1 Tax=Brevibacillus porteri TaxID=2126350 RepID=UPI00370B60F2